MVKCFDSGLFKKKHPDNHEGDVIGVHQGYIYFARE